MQKYKWKKSIIRYSSDLQDFMAIFEVLYKTSDPFLLLKILFPEPPLLGVYAETSYLPSMYKKKDIVSS